MRRYGDEIAGLAAPLTDPGDLDVLVERVDHAVRSPSGEPRTALAEFDRWPRWMWANEEVADFCRWLHGHNLGVERKVGFHGLDVFSLWEWLRTILAYLEEHAPAEVPAALAAYQCFKPYGENVQDYARAARLVPASCENEVVDLLVRMRSRSFTAWQNAEVVAGAERYYRAMIGGGRQSWNIRDCHMADTLDRLLARDRHGPDQVALVGFGGHHGTVVAGDAWGAPARTMPVPPARAGSLEDVLHHAAPERGLFVWPPDGLDLLTDELDHRAIGVVYHPERWGDYVPTVLGRRYDAFLWFDETRALELIS